MARPVDVSDLVAGAREGQVRATARLISLVEDGSPLLREIMSALSSTGGRASVIGLTGAPGVGKSTTTSALITHLRGRGLRVGVLAVDPTSPFSGGALLGDRIRMQDHATDPGVFIRSMASRGHLGGLAWSTPQAIRILDSIGFDVILVETVGVGQSEVEVAALTDTSIVLLAPGMGDGIQAAKAGILEIADILVVNKADRPGADVTVRELRHMLDLGRSGPRGGGGAAARRGGRADRQSGGHPRPAGALGAPPPPHHQTTGRADTPADLIPDADAAALIPDADAAAAERWLPPVLKLIASQGEGVAELGAAVQAHVDWLASSGTGGQRRLARARAEVLALAQAQIQSRVDQLGAGQLLETLAQQVSDGHSDPYAAADDLLAALGLPVR